MVEGWGLRGINCNKALIPCDSFITLKTVLAQSTALFLRSIGNSLCARISVFCYSSVFKGKFFPVLAA